MKLSNRNSFLSESFFLAALSLVLLTEPIESRLPNTIRIAGIFDQGGDPNHELGFRAAIDSINDPLNLILPGTKLEAETMQIPPGAR